jgi:DNA invertase Pin-like site-specific DNA recombinase
MKEKIIELRLKGFSVNQIVKSLGCSKSNVSYHINKNGLGGKLEEERDNKFIFDNETIDKIKSLRLELKTYKEILEIIDISEDNLIKICRELKLNKGVNTKTRNLDKDLILKTYLELKSLRDTAKVFGMDRSTIRKFIDDDKILIKREKTVSKSKAVIDYRRRVKKKLIEYKGGSCEKCGYNKSEHALHFHHLDPNQKDFTISGKSYSFERMKYEVDKCILVCSNCHCEIHEGILKI